MSSRTTDFVYLSGGLVGVGLKFANNPKYGISYEPFKFFGGAFLIISCLEMSNWWLNSEYKNENSISKSFLKHSHNLISSASLTYLFLWFHDIFKYKELN